MNYVNVFAPELRGTIKRDVPFLPGAWVSFYDDITPAMLEQAKAETERTGEAMNSDLLLLSQMIADWNFADEKGKRLDITVDNLKKLSLTKFLAWLINTQGEILKVMQAAAVSKKNSPASS